VGGKIDGIDRFCELAGVRSLLLLIAALALLPGGAHRAAGSMVQARKLEAGKAALGKAPA